MVMDGTEISWNYRYAVNKQEMIKILAELNDCDKSVIEDILEQKGLLEKPKPKRPNKSRWSKKEDKVLIDCIAAGMNSRQTKMLLPRRSLSAVRARAETLGIKWKSNRNSIYLAYSQYPHFSSTLTKLMEENNVSTVNLAWNLGVHKNSVYNWKKGIKRPNEEMMENLANYFGVSIETFLNDKEGNKHGR